MRLRNSLGLLACALLVGCGSSPLPRVRAVAEGGEAIGEDVMGFAVITGISNDPLVKTAAQNRAMNEVAAMLTVGGTEFTMQWGYGYSALQATTAGRGAMTRVSHRPIEGGWLAMVSGKRSGAVAAEMRALPSKVGRAVIENTDLQTAYRIARSRAARAVIAEFVGDTCSAPCEVKGKLTLIAMEVQLPSSTSVEVSVRAHAVIEDTSDLEPEARQQFQKAVLSEYAQGGDTVEAAEAAVEANPTSPMSYALVGSAAIRGAKFGRAVESFEKAFDLAPEDIEFALALSRAHDLHGDLEKSAQALLAAAKLAPEDEGLARKYEGLRSNLAMDGIEVPALLPVESEGVEPAPPEDEGVETMVPVGGETVIDLRPKPKATGGGGKRKGKKRKRRRRRK